MMNETFEYCKHQHHLINQGIHWCEKQVKDYPDCCNKDCPYYEAIIIKSTLTSAEGLYETNKTRKETNKKRRKTN